MDVAAVNVRSAVLGISAPGVSSGLSDPPFDTFLSCPFYTATAVNAKVPHSGEAFHLGKAGFLSHL